MNKDEIIESCELSTEFADRYGILALVFSAQLLAPEP